MAPRRLPLSPTGPEHRRRRRRLTQAGLLMGFAGAGLLGGLALEGAPPSPFLDVPWPRALLAALLLLGALLALRVGRAERALAGGGYLGGRAMTGAGLAVALGAALPHQWDRGLFGLGLAIIGLWLSKGAAAPVDRERMSQKRPARPRERGAAGP